MAGAVLNIAEMIDLALGTPEVGTVDFVMLHTVLHCLAQQVRCTDKNVEVRGSLAMFPVGRQPEDAHTIMVNEYIIETDGQAPAPGEEPETILVAERVGREERVPIPKSGLPAASMPMPRVSTTPLVRAPTTPARVSTATPARVSMAAGAKPAKGGDQVAGQATSQLAAKSVTRKSTKLGGIVSTVAGAVAEPGTPAEVDDEDEADDTEGNAIASTDARSKHARQSATAGTEDSVAGELRGGGEKERAGEEADETETTITGTGVPSKTSSVQRLQRLPSSEKLSLVTLSKFNLLQSTVQDLKNRVYGTLPNNEELLEGVRSQSNMKGITDMWASLNVSSRLEAAEAGIAKLSSLMQDIIGQDLYGQDSLLGQGQVGQGQTGQDQSGPDGVSEKPTDKETPGGETSTAPKMGKTLPEWATKEDVAQFTPFLQDLKEELDQLSNTFYNAMKEMDHKVEPPVRKATVVPLVKQRQSRPSTPKKVSTPASAKQPSTTVPADTAVNSPDGLTEPATVAPTDAGAITMNLTTQSSIAQQSYGAGVPTQDLSVINEKLKSLERRLNQCYDVVFSPNGNILDQLNALQDQIEENTRQRLAAAMTCGADGGGGPSPELVKELQGLMALYKTVHTMQTQLQQVHETALQLSAEKEERQLNTNSLLEQIELLKAIKLDREDMVEALADKADLRMLARKVSHDQFEMACDDLSRGLEQALGKVNVQESLWQQALDDIQREIETKLDKVELSPVKEFFNKKLKQLQEHLKQMSSLRKEVEAAGTKKKLYTDVNCISCDAKAFMQTEASSSMPPKPLHVTKSMKPYLTYELDAIRKSQSTNVQQRNMHDWEKIDKQMTTPRQVQKVRSETDKHLCNRYCGGSHTTTTPSQRVARLGHFIKQWGPEVLPLASGFATGDDGRIYKISCTESVAVGPGGAVDAPCTPKPPAKKDQRQPSKAGLTPDCRCLDDVMPPRK